MMVTIETLTINNKDNTIKTITEVINQIINITTNSMIKTITTTITKDIMLTNNPIIKTTIEGWMTTRDPNMIIMYTSNHITKIIKEDKMTDKDSKTSIVNSKLTTNK